MNNVKIASFTVGKDSPLLLMAGPCVIESQELLFEVAEKVIEITNKLGINFIFKSSFDKANRSSINSFRGPGIEKGLDILRNVKNKYKIPVMTDVHEPWQCEEVAKVVDLIQIPAFLARQTDLIVSAAKTGLPVNIKKGQFMAPNDMVNVVTKMQESGNNNTLLCERGTTFGYGNLVVDMRSFPIMKENNVPIIFDATHSVQRPGGNGTSTGGDREFIPYLMRAAAAVGIDGIFAEVHPDPAKGLSDSTNMLPLDQLEEILKPVIEIDNIVRNV